MAVGLHMTLAVGRTLITNTHTRGGSCLELVCMIFCKLTADLYPLIDVDWDFYAHLAFSQLERR